MPSKRKTRFWLETQQKVGRFRGSPCKHTLGGKRPRNLAGGGMAWTFCFWVSWDPKRCPNFLEGHWLWWRSWFFVVSNDFQRWKGGLMVEIEDLRWYLILIVRICTIRRFAFYLEMKGIFVAFFCIESATPVPQFTTLLQDQQDARCRGAEVLLLSKL